MKKKWMYNFFNVMAFFCLDNLDNLETLDNLEILEHLASKILTS